MHLHLGFAQGVVIFLYVLVFMGVMKLLAMRFEGHPLANAILEVY